MYSGEIRAFLKKVKRKKRKKMSNNRRVKVYQQNAFVLPQTWKAFQVIRVQPDDLKAGLRASMLRSAMQQTFEFDSVYDFPVNTNTMIAGLLKPNFEYVEILGCL